MVVLEVAASISISLEICARTLAASSDLIAPSQDFMQGKELDSSNGVSNVRLPQEEALSQGVRLLARQAKNSAAASSVRVWMGQGNGWSHPIILSRQDGQVRGFVFSFSCKVA